MKKKVIATLLAAGMMTSAFACTAQAADVTLVMAEENSQDSLSGKVAQYFADKVSELTDGAVEIDLQCSKVLGSETEILDGMIAMAGTVDIERVTTSRFTNYGCNKAALLGLPYLFEDREHFWALADSDLKDEIFEDISVLGVTGLSFYEEGFRSFFFSDPVEDYTGIANKKIRVADDPIMRGIVEGLGGSPTVISSGELYTSLQCGVVDGAEQPIANYKANSFPEVANNLILDGHTLGAIQAVITDTAWAKLTEEQQGWIMEAAKYVQNYNAEISQAKEDEVLELLKSEGCNVVEVADNAPWAEACSAIIEQETSSQAELYAQLLAMK